MSITAKGKLLLWGSNDRGQLGINIKDYVNQPKLFTALAEDIIIQVSCGENHTAIVTGQSFKNYFRFYLSHELCRGNI